MIEDKFASVKKQVGRVEEEMKQEIKEIKEQNDLILKKLSNLSK